jgi:hypothetical protein
MYTTNISTIVVIVEYYIYTYVDGKLQDHVLLLKIHMGVWKNISKNSPQYGYTYSRRFTCPALTTHCFQLLGMYAAEPSFLHEAKDLVNYS